MAGYLKSKSSPHTVTGMPDSRNPCRGSVSAQKRNFATPPNSRKCRRSSLSAKRQYSERPLILRSVLGTSYQKNKRNSHDFWEMLLELHVSPSWQFSEFLLIRKVFSELHVSSIWQFLEFSEKRFWSSTSTKKPALRIRPTSGKCFRSPITAKKAVF